MPGIGKILSLVLLDDLHDVHRCPRGQAVVSSGRLVTWARASAGKRYDTSGTTIGKAHLQGAWAAAVLCRRDPPAAQQSLARLEKNHAKGTARTIRAQQLARAVSHRRTRQVAFEREMGFPREGRGADEPGAALDTQGMPLHKARACA